MRKVIVKPYQEEWLHQFQQEAQTLHNLFGSLVVDIHHIGSTAVPGLAAKPVIDLLPVVTHIEQVDAFNARMEALGYEPRGENGLPGRRYFQKGGDNRTHHVHVFEVGNPEIERHLVFRDYLRAYPEEALRYGELKLELARTYSTDISSYIEGKHDFVQQLEKQAIAWQASKIESL